MELVFFFPHVPGLEPGSSDSQPNALTTELLYKAVALAYPRYSWPRMLKVAPCTVARSYIQIFWAWWVATILYSYGATRATKTCEHQNSGAAQLWFVVSENNHGCVFSPFISVFLVYIITWSFSRAMMISTLTLIGCCDYFGFGFLKLNRKLFYSKIFFYMQK